MIELCYKVNDQLFRENELIAVRWKNPFNDEVIDYVGRIVRSTLADEIRLDISSRYNANVIDIRLDEIININEVGGVS